MKAGLQYSQSYAPSHCGRLGLTWRVGTKPAYFTLIRTKHGLVHGEIDMSAWHSGIVRFQPFVSELQTNLRLVMAKMALYRLGTCQDHHLSPFVTFCGKTLKELIYEVRRESC